MSEDAVEEHEHSKKRRHEDNNEGDGKKKKKHKKSKEVPVAENLVPIALTADTVADTENPPVDSEIHKKKKNKHKDKESEKRSEQQDAVEVVTEMNDENASAVPLTEPQPEVKKKKKHKHKEKEKHSEQQNAVEMVTEMNDENACGVPLAESQPEIRKRKKDKHKEKERGNEQQSNIGMATEMNDENTSAVLLTEPQPEKKKRKKDRHKDKAIEKDIEGNSDKPTSSLRNMLDGANYSEDILRVFQQLDLAHLQGALGSLDLPSINSDILPDSLPNFSMPKKAASKAPRKELSVDNSETSKKAKRKRIVDVKNLVDPNAGDSQSNLLATKWMSSKELNEFAATQGIVLKKGKFSFTEEHAMKTAIEHYRVGHNLSEDELTEFIFGKHTPVHKLFWAEVALAVPGRPVQAVYHHIKRSYSPLSGQGKWIPEEDMALRRAVADLGPSWTKVSERIGRTAGSCRDRWRNHISQPSKQTGKWSEEEKEKLLNIIRTLTVDKGKDMESEVFWSIVSDKMGGTRSREQCRSKWVEDLRFKVEDQPHQRWSKRHIHLLLQRMAALPVNDDSEIDWKDLATGDLKLWSAHWLQKAWKKVERTAPDYENMPYKDTLDFLLEQYEKEKYKEYNSKKKKFPQAPEPKSAEVIGDSGDDETDDDPDIDHVSDKDEDEDENTPEK